MDHRGPGGKRETMMSFARPRRARESTEISFFWLSPRHSLFGRARDGPDDLCRSGRREVVLACFEEAMRHRKLGAVVAEVSLLSMTASRRLQLAAEGSGVIGLALRRWRGQARAGRSFPLRNRSRCRGFSSNVICTSTRAGRLSLDVNQSVGRPRLPFLSVIGKPGVRRRMSHAHAKQCPLFSKLDQGADR